MTDMLYDRIIGRRTVHHFETKKIDEKLVIRGLEAFVWAPNHFLSEPWRFYLIGDETKKRIIDLNTALALEKRGKSFAETKRKRWSAVPGWLLINCIKSSEENKFLEDYAACCCGVQNFMLSMWLDGVGVKWTTGSVTRNADFAKIIGFDVAEEMVVGLLWFGAPKVIPKQKRSPIQERLFRLS